MVILNGWMLDVNRFLWDVPLDVPNLLLAITTDASDVAMGAIIEQRGPHGWEPLAFWSKKLSDTQQDWCPYDRELNAAHKAIRHFKHMVEGRPFTLYTDHQSLVPSIHKKTDAPTARQTNQLSEIAEFTTDIRYLEGKSNFVADALSRPNGILSNKAAASVSNISSVANDRHVFLQHLDMLQSSATISSFCFCHHLKPIQSQPTISSISQPSRTASAADPPASRQRKVTFASPVASDNIREKQRKCLLISKKNWLISMSISMRILQQASQVPRRRQQHPSLSKISMSLQQQLMHTIPR